MYTPKNKHIRSQALPRGTQALPTDQTPPNRPDELDFELHFGGILVGKKATGVTEVTNVTAISVTLT